MKQEYLVLIIESIKIYALRVGGDLSELQVLSRFDLNFDYGELVAGRICNFTQFQVDLGNFLLVNRLDRLPVILVLGDGFVGHKLVLSNQTGWYQVPEGYLQQLFSFEDYYYLTQALTAQVLQYSLLLNSLKLYLQVVTSYSAALMTYLRVNQIKFSVKSLEFAAFQKGLASDDLELDRDRVAMGAVCQGQND